MLKVKRDFFPACAQPLNLKAIISMKHVTQKCLIANFYGRAEELLRYLIVWKVDPCLLSGWKVDVLFSIYNWKSWKSVGRIKSLGQRKDFFFLFGHAPVTLRHAKDFSLCYHYFHPLALLLVPIDLSSCLSCSKLTCGINRLRHEPFPGKDITNTRQD